MSDTARSETARTETHRFDAEVHQLLKLMINALYSNRDIFLRELISNASDACDKLRFQALTDDGLQGTDSDLAIDVTLDAEAGTLTVADTGIGMSRDDVIENIGTIARSGTRKFLEQLSGDQQQDARLIGQFGVGFYSAFMVADRVVLETRRADLPADQGVCWSSDGSGTYDLGTAEIERPGTTVILHLREDHRDLLEAAAVRSIIHRYSNHVAFPIRLHAGEGEPETVNDTQALWLRPRNELTADDYKNFYSGLAGDPEAPLSWAHHHVEGSQRYSLLLYLPARAPFDLWMNRDEREGMKLYIQRVFIMDAAEELVPRYLRFLRGVVDAGDLPLNVSREILQDSPLLKRIRRAVTKRGLDMLEKLAGDRPEDWRTFWNQFGPVLKEGIVEDPDNRGRIVELLRFDSTRAEAPTSLSEYVGRMAGEQETIWYLTAESAKAAAGSPHLEVFRQRGIEVLLLTDRIDEWVVAHLNEYDGKALKSVARGNLDFDDTPEVGEEDKALAGRIKQALGEQVGNVKPGHRLTDSPGCIVADEHGLPLHLQRMLKQAGQEVPESAPDLEINPRHPLLAHMAALPDGERFKRMARVLFDQALLSEGGELTDPAGFVRRVNELLLEGVAAPETGTTAAEKE